MYYTKSIEDSAERALSAVSSGVEGADLRGVGVWVCVSVRALRRVATSCITTCRMPRRPGIMIIIIIISSSSSSSSICVVCLLLVVVVVAAAVVVVVVVVALSLPFIIIIIIIIITAMIGSIEDGADSAGACWAPAVSLAVIGSEHMCMIINVYVYIYIYNVCTLYIYIYTHTHP